MELARILLGYKKLKKKKKNEIYGHKKHTRSTVPQLHYVSSLRNSEIESHDYIFNIFDPIIDLGFGRNKQILQHPGIVRVDL